MIPRKLPNSVKNALQNSRARLRSTKKNIHTGLTIMPWGPKERLRSNRKTKRKPVRLGSLTASTKSAQLRTLRKAKRTGKITSLARKEIQKAIGELRQDILELSVHHQGLEELVRRREILKKQARIKVLQEFLG